MLVQIMVAASAVPTIATKVKALSEAAQIWRGAGEVPTLADLS